jgi:hypothetical protein
LPIARLAKDDPRSAWLAKRALLLTCTSHDMLQLWNAMAAHGWVDSTPDGSIPGVQDEDLRRRLRAEIDAFVAMHVYELHRRDLDHVIGTFTQLEGIERKAHGEFLTRRLVLAEYDRMAAGVAAAGRGWSSTLDVPAGHGPRPPG